MIAVYRQEGQTYNEIIYEDMRTERLTTQHLLERTAFNEDPRRRQRLAALEEQRIIAEIGLPPRGPIRALSQKRSRRRRARQTNTYRSKMNRISGRGPVCRHVLKEGFLSPTKWSWSRPGIFPAGVPQALALRGGGAGIPAGPGLPNGDATGDDD